MSARARADLRQPCGACDSVTTTRCVNEKEAATYLAVSVHTLRSWRRQRRGPQYVKIAGGERNGRGLSGRVAYRLSDLIAFLESATVPTELPRLPE